MQLPTSQPRWTTNMSHKHDLQACRKLWHPTNHFMSPYQDADGAMQPFVWLQDQHFICHCSAAIPLWQMAPAWTCPHKTMLAECQLGNDSHFVLAPNSCFFGVVHCQHAATMYMLHAQQIRGRETSTQPTRKENDRSLAANKAEFVQ